MDEPDTIEVDGQRLCRLHHTPLVFDPAWAFSVFAEYPGMGSPSVRFPNAKWGHPAAPGMAEFELVGLTYCPVCEADRRRWLTGAVSEDPCSDADG
jgi:hypothetical protein